MVAVAVKPLKKSAYKGVIAVLSCIHSPYCYWP